MYVCLEDADSLVEGGRANLYLPAGTFQNNAVGEGQFGNAKNQSVKSKMQELGRFWLP